MLLERIDFMSRYDYDRPFRPEEEFPNEMEDAPIVLHKFDFYGRPIVISRVRNIHPGWYTDDSLRTYTTWLNTKIYEAFPKNVDNYIVIYDFKDSGLSNINYH